MRIFKEKRPHEAIMTGVFTTDSPRPGFFLGVYQAPAVGVRLVRDKLGDVRQFTDEASARSAATSALLAALNAKKQPMVSPKEIRFGRRW